MKLSSPARIVEKFRRFLFATTLLAGALHSHDVSAQQIFWQTPAAITGDSDVVTNGTPVYAYDWANSSQTVNGISFSGAGGASVGNLGTTLGTVVTTLTSTANPFNALSSEYKGILTGGIYTTSTSAYTVTLSNLISGHAYVVQFWVNDPRGAENARTVTLSSVGGNSVTLDYSTGPGTTAGYAGQFCVGYFTNYGGAQTFMLQSFSSVTVPQMNAIQVEDLGQAVQPNVGYWNGLGGSVLNYSALDFCTNVFTAPLGTSASLANVAGLTNPVFFGDSYYNSSTPVAVTVSNITVAAGGITNSAVDFINTNVNYTLASSDANGITGATTVGLYGTGAVTLAGPNTYAGGTFIAPGGTLQVGAGGASGSLGTGPVANFGSLVFDRSDNAVFTNVITGVGLLTQTGSGSLTLSNAIVGGPYTVLAQTGAGVLNLTGSNTYGGTLVVAQGTVNINGSGPGGSPYGNLYIGGNTGSATVNFNTTATWSIGTSASGTFYVGGTGLSSDTSAGAFNQTAGNIMFSDGNYFTLGAGGTTCYGSYVQSGGTFTVEDTEGVRIGEGGLGSWVQTGGTFTSPRYFVVGGNGSTGSANIGIATFLGGTTSEGSSYFVILGNTSGAYGVINMGTEAGGNGTFITTDTGNGPYLGQVSGATGILNLNSGIMAVSSGIQTAAGGSGTLNLNGGTLQAGAGNGLINASVNVVTIYNGGLTVNDQSFNNTIAAAMIGATGNGIYPAGGILTIPSGGGSGYIGAPIVTVSGGSGSGAMAIATVSNGVVTNVALTCPGQNYLVGDMLSFAFAGGGASNLAPTFNYTLKASDVASNTVGGLLKVGSGTLTLSGANTYTGTTIVGVGTLNVSVDGGLGLGNVVVANGASLTLTNGNTNGYISPTANLALNATATNNLNYNGNMTINGLSTNGGLNYVAPGVYGAIGSGAAHQLSQLTGSGLLTVSSTPVVSGVQVVLTISPNPCVAGQTVTFTATVTGSGAIPSGTVTFLSGGVVLGSAALNGSGVAVFMTNFPSAGTDSITANYSGNGAYSSATVLFATSVTVNPRQDFWSGAKNGTWDINTTSNWFYLGSNATYHDTDAVQLDDTALSNTAVSLNVVVNPNSVVFSNNVKNYSLSGTGSISGAASLTKLGTGTLVVSNTNAYTGNTLVSNGVVTFNGPGSSTGGGVLDLGDGNGLAVMNLNGTGTLNFSGSVSIGGVTGDTNDDGSGALNVTSGTVNFATNSSGIYVELGTGGTNGYGSLNQSGGTINILNLSGTRIGQGGYGSWVQTGGILNCSRYFVVGGNYGTAGSTNDGVATFLGGSANLGASYYLIVGNLNPSSGVMNLGTQAGGNAVFTHADGTGPYVAQVSGSTGTLNLNSGIFNTSGPLETGGGGQGVVNFNGGILQAGGDNSIISASVPGVYVYNGGAVMDSQSYTTMNSASMQAATGNGIYPSSGVFTISSGGGSNYIGAPLVTINGGSGFGALAVATVSNGVVTNIAMTCPGQNYLAGDMLSFVFTGGGTATPAVTFNYTLKPADVASNNGGMTKIGSGTLVFNGNGYYTGNTVVSNGTLEMDGYVTSPVIVTGGALDGIGTVYGPVTVQAGGTLGAGSSSAIGQFGINGALTLSGTVSLRLDNTGGAMNIDSIQGLTSVTYGGTLDLTNITSDGTPLAAGDTFTLFTASAYSGSFATVNLPELGGGLAWSVSNLPVNGSIQVVSVSTNSPSLTYGFSGKTLNLSWPSANTGWRLLVQTNNLAKGISLNINDWGTVPDSSVTNQVSLPISTTGAGDYYRLVYP